MRQTSFKLPKFQKEKKKNRKKESKVCILLQEDGHSFSSSAVLCGDCGEGYWWWLFLIWCLRAYLCATPSVLLPSLPELFHVLSVLLSVFICLCSPLLTWFQLSFKDGSPHVDFKVSCFFSPLLPKIVFVCVDLKSNQNSMSHINRS